MVAFKNNETLWLAFKDQKLTAWSFDFILSYCYFSFLGKILKIYNQAVKFTLGLLFPEDINQQYCRAQCSCFISNIKWIQKVHFFLFDCFFNQIIHVLEVNSPDLAFYRLLMQTRVASRTCFLCWERERHLRPDLCDLDERY